MIYDPSSIRYRTATSWRTDRSAVGEPWTPCSANCHQPSSSAKVATERQRRRYNSSELTSPPRHRLARHASYELRHEKSGGEDHARSCCHHQCPVPRLSQRLRVIELRAPDDESAGQNRRDHDRRERMFHDVCPMTGVGAPGRTDAPRLRPGPPTSVLCHAQVRPDRRCNAENTHRFRTNGSSTSAG